ncbi:sulfite exporter TauE/SafE family protein [Kroppenstedtia pulmonis]|uniref:Probable membrane transporter protein n=1 Tax=Kroppenstedtia pulmonis TaxID=1380685 RepID=A0A7D4CUW6_9BACL|nr:sulfite exporter TauE/SafE family protein [Kroppenstedtia pulmonis]QKG83737.1 sulfite exporter TauE/SafE family protein [Kroppenstedtia pulmonis]
MSFTDMFLILIAGFFGGIINTLAAGGSLLTLPVLIFLGLPSAVANGTNRVALVVQSIVATANFHRKGYFDKKLGILLSIPAVVGSVIGANIASAISDQLFNKILAVIMVIAVIFIIWKPERRIGSIGHGNYSVVRKIWGIIIFFFVGIYGGFIQVGAGFFIIAALTGIFGISLVKSNSMKVFVGGVYIFISLFVFMFNGQIDWYLGLSLAVGNALGAWVGSLLAIYKGDKWIRIFLVITVFFMAGKLLGFFEF